MTPLQKRMFDFIQQYINTHTYSPSLVEIAEGVGISPNSISLVSRHVHALVAAGMLKFHKKGYRSVQVVENTPQLSLKLAGHIVNGKLIWEDQHVMDLHHVLHHDAYFMLKIKGNDMISESIVDGDFVICKPASQAYEGDKVLALVNGEKTMVGRISYEIPDHITLIPGQAGTKPKAYLPHRVQIQGILVGVLRLNAY